ncbi:MAG TPA: TetR/AcrR family transcriptional regulator [Pyrinomonadaceae bacterium]|jgi:TetR/AcrR family fatty acid metabolism transcriptional regulator|nr:TetR/AcrR family transcriptional regulator [Pyrinomonadaceae bacterium]
MSKNRSSSAQARAVSGDKREAIHRSAIKVFAGKGYFNSKVADIAGEAGIADGTVYLYFKSKDDILHSIFDRAMAEFIAEGKREIEGLNGPEEKLRRIAELHLEKLGADRELAIVFQVELRGSTKFMQEFSAAGFAEYLDIIRETIAEGQAKGIFRDDIKPVVCAKVLYGALDEMVTNWILSKKQYPLAPMADEVLKIYFGGVRAG